MFQGLTEPLIYKVFLTLVIPDKGKKNIIKKTVKELWDMQIRINPSDTCDKIRIVQVGSPSASSVSTDTTDAEDLFALEAVAGSVVSDLKVETL